MGSDAIDDIYSDNYVKQFIKIQITPSARLSYIKLNKVCQQKIKPKAIETRSSCWLVKKIGVAYKVHCSNDRPQSLKTSKQFERRELETSARDQC